jgi:hypothetical protein
LEHRIWQPIRQKGLGLVALKELRRSKEARKDLQGEVLDHLGPLEEALDIRGSWMIVRYEQLDRGIEAYSLATEPNSLFGIEDRTFPNQGFYTTSTSVDLVESDLTEDFATIFPLAFVNAGHD